jgi:hypothetical protein
MNANPVSLGDGGALRCPQCSANERAPYTQYCLVSIPVESKTSSLLPICLKLAPAVRFFRFLLTDSDSQESKKLEPRGSTRFSRSKQ